MKTHTINGLTRESAVKHIVERLEAQLEGDDGLLEELWKKLFNEDCSVVAGETDWMLQILGPYDELADLEAMVKILKKHRKKK